MAAPPKKMCVARSNAGRKNEDVHRHFEPTGEPFRVRCKLCYQKWFQEEVESLVATGVDDAQAKITVKSQNPSPQVRWNGINKTINSHFLPDCPNLCQARNRQHAETFDFKA